MKSQLNQFCSGVARFSYCTEPCWDLCRDIYIPHCEEDHIGECLQSPKSTGSVLDDLDDPIETFSDGVGQMGVDEGDDVCAVLSKGAHQFSHGLETASEG